MNLEQEVLQIKKRNERVEADKAWEVSATRRALIALLTYAAIAVFFVVVGFPHPLLSALVPTAGFVLSTLSLSFAKTLWMRDWRDKHPL